MAELTEKQVRKICREEIMKREGERMQRIATIDTLATQKASASNKGKV